MPEHDDLNYEEDIRVVTEAMGIPAEKYDAFIIDKYPPVLKSHP